MKILNLSMQLPMIALTLICSMTSFSALAVTADDLKGSFLVGQLDIQGPYYVAEFAVDQTGTSVDYRDATMERVRPNGQCAGTFVIQQDIAKVKIKCMGQPVTEMNFEIGLKNTTVTQLENGVQLQIRSDLSGGEPLPFKVFKRTTSFFDGAPKSNVQPLKLEIQ